MDASTRWSATPQRLPAFTPPPIVKSTPTRDTAPDVKHHSLTTIQDVATDAIMVADKANAQEADARKFTQVMLDYAKQHDIPNNHVTVAGYSLGGTLAEIEA